MNEETDLLQIKIEKAKAELSEDTLNAINAVDFKAVILEMRQKRGYTFEQLGDLETETELLLCGLVSQENYPKELENRLHLSKTEVSELIKEMNDKVFAKIKENMIKGIEGKKIFPEEPIKNSTKNVPLNEEESNTQVLNTAGIEIISEAKKETPPIFAQKLSGYVKNDVVETQHSLENLTSSNPTPSPIPQKPTSTIDPYRERPE